MICACGFSKPHFACDSCGMHAGVDNLPCIRCRFFKFTPVGVEPMQPIHPTPALVEVEHAQPERRRKRTRDAQPIKG